MSAKVLLLFVAVVAGLAINNPLAAQTPAVPTVSASVAQVIKLHESGVGPDVLLAYVKETPITKPNADEVLYLTEKGIPKEVIIAMLSKRVWADNHSAQSEPAPVQNHSQLPPAVATAQPATQTVVHVQQPAPTVTYVSGPPYYYDPWYYNPWPAFAVGVGFGYGYGWGHGGWGGGHWGHSGWGHHGGGIHVHHR